MTILSTLLAKLAAALASLALLLGLAHAAPPAAVSVSPGTPTSVAGLIPSGALSASSVSPQGVFSDKNWSVSFTIRPEWNVNETLDANNKLHQMLISGAHEVIFISKDEGIGLSSDLTYTTATRTIAGKSVEVRTYTKPNASFAYYELFTLPETDGAYTFYFKSTVPDTTITDTFIRSITHG